MCGVFPTVAELMSVPFLVPTLAKLSFTSFHLRYMCFLQLSPPGGILSCWIPVSNIPAQKICLVLVTVTATCNHQFTNRSLLLQNTLLPKHLESEKVSFKNFLIIILLLSYLSFCTHCHLLLQRLHIANNPIKQLINGIKT